MSYHDSNYHSYPDSGVSVVNPLIQNEKKLKKIKTLLIASETTEMTVPELREQIAKVLNEYE
jgi:hypothetical protein